MSATNFNASDISSTESRDRLSATSSKASDIYPADSTVVSPGLPTVSRSSEIRLSAASKKVSDKPREIASTRVGIRVPDALLADLDARSTHAGMSRSDFIRALIALPLDLEIGTGRAGTDGHEVQVITDSTLIDIRGELDQIAGLYDRCAKSLTIINRRFTSRATLPEDVRAELTGTLDLLMKRITLIKNHVQGIESSLDALDRKPTVRLDASGKPLNIFKPRAEVPRANNNKQPVTESQVSNPSRAEAATDQISRTENLTHRSERSVAPSELRPEFSTRHRPPADRNSRRAEAERSRKYRSEYECSSTPLDDQPEFDEADFIATHQAGDLDAIMSAKTTEAELYLEEQEGRYGTQY